MTDRLRSPHQAPDAPLLPSVDKQATSAAQIDPWTSVCSTGSIVVCVCVCVPLYVSFLIVHVCVTHFHALETVSAVQAHPSPDLAALSLRPVPCPVPASPARARGVWGCSCLCGPRGGAVCCCGPSQTCPVCSDLSCLLCVQMAPCPICILLWSSPFFTPTYSTPAASSLCPEHATLEVPGFSPLARTPRWPHAVLALRAPRRKADCLGPREVGSH